MGFAWKLMGRSSWSAAYWKAWPRKQQPESLTGSGPWAFNCREGIPIFASSSPPAILSPSGGVYGLAPVHDFPQAFQITGLLISSFRNEHPPQIHIYSAAGVYPS